MIVRHSLGPTEVAGPAQLTEATPQERAKAAKAAHDFEAMTLDQMLQPMFATLDTDPLFGGGDAEKILQPMLVTEMAKIMEKRGGLGLSDTIAAKMLQLEGKRP